MKETRGKTAAEIEKLYFAEKKYTDKEVHQKLVEGQGNKQHGYDDDN